MSKVKQAIETALECINGARRNTYGAEIYTAEQVTSILKDLLETASEDTTAGVMVTIPQLDQLVGIIEQSIDTSIHNMSDSDIVDEDSIEMTISGGRVNIDNVDVNKDNIVVEASAGIDNDVYDWAERVGIYTA